MVVTAQAVQNPAYRPSGQFYYFLSLLPASENPVIPNVCEGSTAKIKRRRFLTRKGFGMTDFLDNKPIYAILDVSTAPARPGAFFINVGQPYHRHCEELQATRQSMDCFASLAMTTKKPPNELMDFLRRTDYWTVGNPLKNKTALGGSVGRFWYF